MSQTNPARSSTVVSADGTPISFEQSGQGDPVILVASALADRGDTKRLAALLATDHTVINYDRRGRGSSGDTAPYAVQREIEDIAALVEHAGGSASLFGSSSGAVLALRAAASGLPVHRVVAYEPPFAVRPEAAPPAGYAARIDALLAEGRRAEGVKTFMTQVQQMPAVMVAMMRLMPPMWRALVAMAHTLPYDIAVMGETQAGRPLSSTPWSEIKAPTLILTGGKSAASFHEAGTAVAKLIPGAVHTSVPGLNHSSVVASPKRLAPTVTTFLKG